MSSIRRTPTGVKRQTDDRLRDGRRRNWFWVGNDTLDAYLPRIGPHAWAVYCYLVRRGDRADQCWPSLRTIAGDTGVSRPTVIASIRLLEEVGLLRVEARTDDSGDATTHLYTVLGGQRGLPPGQQDEPPGGQWGLPRVVNAVDPNNTQVNKTQIEEEVSPRLMQLWAATIDGVHLPQALAGDVHLLQPVSWSDGRLVLRAPLAAVQRRWEKRADELVRLLAPTAPAPLRELVVQAPVTG